MGTGQHFSFMLGTGQVIAGFDAAVDGMNVGETKTVTIPAAQAYGTTTSASNPLAGQDLTFVITLTGDQSGTIGKNNKVLRKFGHEDK